MQRPPEQYGVAPLHFVSHVPQWSGVSSFVSQPLPSASFAPSPLQSPKPAEHLAKMQCPVSQLVTAFARLHDVPHAPQLLSVVRVRSQPLSRLPSQSPKFISHSASSQVPSLQRLDPFANVQPCRQTPQCSTESKVASQPSSATSLQSTYPVSHAAIKHSPSEQTAIAWSSLQVVCCRQSEVWFGPLSTTLESVDASNFPESTTSFPPSAPSCGWPPISFGS
ncbi:MAG TPA: hypothetical protein VFG30_29285 [Polyangiales bacterium]|nr:hypothetical protein [Polyangiales bacterium]